MTARKLAIYVVCARAHFFELFPLARSLKRTSDIDAAVYFSDECFQGEYIALEEDASACRREGFQVLSRLTIRKAEIEHSVNPSAPRGLRGLLAKTFDSGFQERSLFFQFRKHLRHKRMARKLMNDVNPSLLILAESNVNDGSAALIAAAHRARASVIVVPYTLANATEAAESFWQDHNHQVTTYLRKIVAKLFPKWALTHRGQPLLRIPPAGILAMELLRLAPPLPWVPNSCDADAILVESDAQAMYFAAAGLPPSVIKVTGSISLDILARQKASSLQKRVDLCTKFGWSPEQPLVLCAFPPDQIVLRRNHCEFQSFDDMRRAWIDALTNMSGCNVILRLHPRLKIEDFRPYESETLRLSEDPTASIIPICDLFVASVSATIRWAIASGKPVVNYDVYKYGYVDYAEAPNVVTLTDSESFKSRLKGFANNPDAEANQSARWASYAATWGQLDNKSEERIASVADSLVNHRER